MMFLEPRTLKDVNPEYYNYIMQNLQQGKTCTQSAIAILLGRHIDISFSKVIDDLGAGPVHIQTVREYVFQKTGKVMMDIEFHPAFNEPYNDCEIKRLIDPWYFIEHNDCLIYAYRGLGRHHMYAKVDGYLIDPVVGPVHHVGGQIITAYIIKG